MSAIKQAFVLGAGLGTRMRPLTDVLPKPLVPIFQKPLVTFAFDHLIAAGVNSFVVNTHHAPAEWARTFPEGKYRECPLHFRHEPVLLETGGGIANVADLLHDEPFLIYNGDILTDLPLEKLIAAHRKNDSLVTLALRSGNGPRQVAFDPESGRLLDIRNQLGTGAPDEYVFTGVYVVEPEFARALERGVKRSVIPSFMGLIRDGGRLGGVVADEGNWWDVGTREAYLELHRRLPELDFPRYEMPDRHWRDSIHPSAIIGAGAVCEGCSVVGANAVVHRGAKLTDTIVWEGAQIASRSELSGCIVRSYQTAEGRLRDQII